jgi:hypothetical protein
VPFARRFVGLLLVGAVLVLPGEGVAGPAPSGLPSRVPEQARLRLQHITERASISTRVEGEPFAARLEVFEFLLDHPEFTTHVTRTLKLARYRIWRVPGGLFLDDGWGATGTFEIVHAAPGLRVMYARGEYKQSMLPNIHGQAVVLVDYASTHGADGKNAIQTAITGFVKLDSRIMALAGQLASSVATAKAEKEGQRLVKVFARTTRAIEENPAAVYEQLRVQPVVPARELESFRRLLNLPAPAAAR